MKKSIKLGLENKLKGTGYSKPGYSSDFDDEQGRQILAKIQVIEDELAQKVTELARGLAHLQRENVGMQRRITESVSQQTFVMQLDLLRSQFEEY